MKLNINLTKAQRQIVDHRANLKFLCCGRRWGKSILAILYMIYIAFTKKNATIWYVAKSYRQTDYAYNKCIKSGILKAGCKARGLSPRFIDFPTGSRITFLSAGLHQEFIDTLRGDGLDLFILEEAAFVSHNFFTRILLPMLLDKNGKGLCISTYNGKNWFYKNVQEGIELDKQVKSGKLEYKQQSKMGWEYPTHTGLKFQGKIGKRLLEIFKKEIPGPVWDEECLCIPSDESDAFNFDNCIVDTLPSNTKEESIMSLYFDEIHGVTYSIVFRISDGAIINSGKFKSSANVLRKLITKFKPIHVLTDCKPMNKIYKLYAKDKIKIVRYRCPISHIRAMCTQLALDVHKDNIKFRKSDNHIKEALDKYKDYKRVVTWLRPIALACGYRDVMRIKKTQPKQFKDIPSDIGKAMFALRHGMKFKINPLLLFGKDYIQ